MWNMNYWCITGSAISAH